MVDIWQIYLVVGLFTILFLMILYLLIKRYLNKRFESEKPGLIRNFKCIDGHIVKSKGELIIDNYLYLNGIKHIYEKKLRIMGQIIKTDCYLPPPYNTFIEYWGYHGEDYMKRKKEKLKLYHKAKLKLISIENEMFHNIYHYLSKFLRKKNYLKKLKQLENQNKYCYNCGTYLDERF